MYYSLVHQLHLPYLQDLVLLPVNDFKDIEQFLDRLPHNNSYDYAMEFRHPS